MGRDRNVLPSAFQRICAVIVRFNRTCNPTCRVTGRRVIKLRYVVSPRGDLYVSVNVLIPQEITLSLRAIGWGIEPWIDRKENSRVNADSILPISDETLPPCRSVDRSTDVITIITIIIDEIGESRSLVTRAL